ncbi:MAG: oligosaccharide flippase family protein, partial [Pseudomonadota bacterium]|nr:oligosaccharide flippase family protein [Pseudomonadota bacterium]
MMRKPWMQAGAYAVGIVIGKLVSFLLLPIITAHLAPESYATLEILVSLADIGSIILGLAAADTLFRFMGEAESPDEGREIVARLFGLILIFSILALIVTQLLVSPVANVIPAGVRPVHLRLLAVSLTMTSLIQLPLGWLRIKDRAFAFLAASVGKTLIQASLIVFGLRAGFGVTAILGAGAVADMLLAGVLCVMQYRASGIRFNRHGIGHILHYSGPLMLSGIAAFALGSLDRWFLVENVPLSEMALYGLAAKF